MNFTYSSQSFTAFRRTITEERLTFYLLDSKKDFSEAVKLYVANTRLCEMFYTPLQGVEVSLRNAMNAEMVAQYGPEWLERGKAPLLSYQQGLVDDAMDTLSSDNKKIANGGLVAELNFGFWVALLGPKYETNLWRPTIRKAFPHRPKGHERHNVHGALNAIRRLRNRVAHHERILHRNLVGDHQLILDVIAWMCPETASWVAAHSSFDPKVIP